jgi:hypothetical protein
MVDSNKNTLLKTTVLGKPISSNFNQKTYFSLYQIIYISFGANTMFLKITNFNYN